MLADAPARQRINAEGCIVAPGFIDVHNHSDGWFLQSSCLAAKVTQGFTSEVLMADGISYAPVSRETVSQWMFYLRGLNGLRVEQYRGWETLSDYMQQMHRRNVQNAAAHLPYANARSWSPAFGRRRSTITRCGKYAMKYGRAWNKAPWGCPPGSITSCNAMPRWRNWPRSAD